MLDTVPSKIKPRSNGHRTCKQGAQWLCRKCSIFEGNKVFKKIIIVLNLRAEMSVLVRTLANNLGMLGTELH